MKVRDVEIANVDEVVINGSRYIRVIDKSVKRERGLGMQDITWTHKSSRGGTDQISHMEMCNRVHILSWSSNFKVWPSGTTINARYATRKD